MSRRRKTRQEMLVSHDRWLVSYADFVTLLFAFFVVLFASSVHNNAALERLAHAIHSGFSGTEASLATQPAASLKHSRAEPHLAAPTQDSTDLALVEHKLVGVLGDSLRKGEIVMQRTPDGLVISLREVGFFNSGEAALLPGAPEKIEQVGEILQHEGFQLRVEGHSDDQPIHNANFQSNWELSAARAMTVLLLLVDRTGYDPTRISMAGYGPYRPAASNATAAGRRMNRRVDLVVVSPTKTAPNLGSSASASHVAVDATLSSRAER